MTGREPHGSNYAAIADHPYCEKIKKVFTI